MDYKMVIGVRMDLKLSKGKTAVQAAHVAVICALKAKKHQRISFSKWYQEGQKKVVVKIKDLKELHSLRQAALEMGFIAEIVRDAGLTEVAPGTITCVGIGPARNEDIDKVTGSYTLM